MWLHEKRDLFRCRIRKINFINDVFPLLKLPTILRKINIYFKNSRLLFQCCFRIGELEDFNQEISARE